MSAERRPGSLRTATLVLAVAWGLLFAPQLFGARIFLSGGDPSAIRAFPEFSRQRWLEHRERTHWNPYIFTGVPTTVSLADSRPQYLPDPLLEVFDRLHATPGWPPLAIPLFLHLAGMIAMAALARALWSSNTVAMIAAGLAWGLFPNLLVPFAFGHDAQLMATSLLPALLLGIHAVFATPGRAALGASLGLGIAVGVVGLAGYPQLVVYALPVTALFALERWLRFRRPDRLAWLAGAAVAGAALSAAVWWPLLQYQGQSVRGGDAGVIAAELAAYSLAPRDLLSLLWPGAVGFGGPTYWGAMRWADFPPYLGATLIALAIVGLGRRDDNDRAARLLAIVTLGAVILALGVHLGGLYDVVHRWMPFWSRFRVVGYILVMAQLGAALLAARGIDTALDPASTHRGVRRIALLAVILLVSAVLVTAGRDLWVTLARGARPALGADAASAAAWRACVDLALRGLLVGALAAAFGPVRRRLGERAMSIGVVALVAVDLALVSVPFLGRQVGMAASLEHPESVPIARLAAANPRFRAVDLTPGRFYSNDWIRWRARSLSGVHGATLRTWDELMRGNLLGADAVMRAFAVRWLGGVGSMADTTGYERAWDTGQDTVWILRGTMARAYAVPRVVSRSDDRLVTAEMSGPAFDPARLAVTTEREAEGNYPGSADCMIRWVRDDPDRLELEVTASGSSFVVIADAWFPGWRAWIDRNEVRVFRVDHLVRGVAVPAGRHRVRLAYEPVGWAAATRVTRLAMLACTLLALAWITTRLRGARSVTA